MTPAPAAAAKNTKNATVRMSKRVCGKAMAVFYCGRLPVVVKIL